MINSFLSTLLYELVHFLTLHKDFFELKREVREEKLQNLKVPAAFKRYLMEVSDHNLLRDLKMAMLFIGGASMNQLALRDNSFFKALVEFLTMTFASKVDELPPHFYLLPHETRRVEVKKIVESDNRMADALRELLVNNSYQEIAGFFHELSQAVTGADMVLVQTPRETDSDFKKELRKFLLEKHSYAFPVFQVNRGLIGGFRVFVNGMATDLSWFSRISKLTSLKTVS